MKKKELKKEIKQLKEKLKRSESQKIKNWIFKEKTRELVYSLTLEKRELEHMIFIIGKRLDQNTKTMEAIINVVPSTKEAVKSAMEDKRPIGI